jgi:hypothetical protein
MGTHVHFALPDLLLSRDAAEEACAGLRLSALEILLARAQAAALPDATLEAWLCRAFGVPEGALAPVTLLADGAPPGTAYWLRADPVHLMLRGSEIILRPLASLDAADAAKLCDTLNRHFAGAGLHFFAPHPQRWYLRLERDPGVETYPLAQVAGRDIRNYLPHGPGALEWHRVLNEIQMLLHGHAVNDARELRGEWSVNSIWPWGGGYAAESIRSPFARVYSDNALAAAFAAAAGLRHVALSASDAPLTAGEEGDTLVVWDGLSHAMQHGDLGAWRDSLQAFEQRCARPMLQALRGGKIDRLTLDALQDRGSMRYTLTRRAVWRFWRLPRRLAQYPRAVVQDKIALKQRGL